MEENYKNESMVDVAYSILLNNGGTIGFKDLFAAVLERLGMTTEEGYEVISSFYTSLSLDGRFVDLKNNDWDLRERQTYDKVHIDMNDVYTDIDEEVAGNADVEELDDSEKEEMGVITDEDEDGASEEEESSKEDM